MWLKGCNGRLFISHLVNESARRLFAIFEINKTYPNLILIILITELRYLPVVSLLMRLIYNKAIPEFRLPNQYDRFRN